MNLLKKIRRLQHQNTFCGGGSYFDEKAIRTLNGEEKYQIEFTSTDYEKEIAIEIHRCAVGILTKTGSMEQIGICGFSRNHITDETKHLERQQGTALSWVGNESPRAPTAIYAVGAHVLFYGFDMATMSNGHLAELIFGNMGPEIPTYVRNDNSDAAYRADTANILNNEKRLNVFLEINGGLEQNGRLGVGRIPGNTNNSDG